MYSNSTLAGRRGGEGSKEKHNYPKGCVYSKLCLATPEKGRGVRNRKEQSER